MAAWVEIPDSGGMFNLDATPILTVGGSGSDFHINIQAAGNNTTFGSYATAEEAQQAIIDLVSIREVGA